MSCHYASLAQDALLHLAGPDARSFLQGQVTCDVRQLSASTALPGAYCTIQGRVVCDFLLCELAADHLVLRMRRDLRAPSASLLGKYIVFSKAALAADRDDWQVLACWGTGAAGHLQHLFGEVPRGKYGTAGGPGFVLVQLDEAGEQFECYLEQAVAASILAEIRNSMIPGAEATWQALQMASSIARVEAATTGEFIPQMLNYDLTGHISFRKGCYTGQEVVARMHYRGKAKRRLYRAKLLPGDRGAGTDALPAAGDPLYCPGTAQAAGNVINCTTTPDGSVVLLVTATAEGVGLGLHLQGPDGARLQTGEVPYPIPEK